MNGLADIHNGIKIQMYPQPKKQKSDKSKYDIYLLFKVKKDSIKQSTPAISTGIWVKVNDWGKKEMKGNNANAIRVNERLQVCLANAKKYLEQEMPKTVTTCSQVKAEILNALKTKVTGNLPHGKKQEIISEASKHTIDNVMLSYFEDNKLCEKRKQQYMTVVNILHEFFNLDWTIQSLYGSLLAAIFLRKV